MWNKALSIRSSRVSHSQIFERKRLRKKNPESRRTKAPEHIQGTHSKINRRLFFRSKVRNQIWIWVFKHDKSSPHKRKIFTRFHLIDISNLDPLCVCFWFLRPFWYIAQPDLKLVIFLLLPLRCWASGGHNHAQLQFLLFLEDIC